MTHHDVSRYKDQPIVNPRPGIHHWRDHCAFLWAILFRIACRVSEEARAQISISASVLPQPKQLPLSMAHTPIQGDFTGSESTNLVLLSKHLKAQVETRSQQINLLLLAFCRFTLFGFFNDFLGNISWRWIVVAEFHRKLTTAGSHGAQISNIAEHLRQGR